MLRGTMKVLIPILMNDSASHTNKSKKIILDIKNYTSMEGRRVTHHLHTLFFIQLNQVISKPTDQ